MKNIFFLNFILLIFCALSQAQSVNTAYLSIANGDVVLADFSTCSTTVVASHTDSFTDISQGDTDNTLYGIRYDASLYRINVSTGVITNLGILTGIGFGGDIEIDSLVKESDGFLLGVNRDAPGELFRIDVNALTATLLGNVGYGSAGDLTYFEGSLYLSADNNELVEVDVTTPSNSTLIGTIPNTGGLNSIFGVVTIITADPCSINPTYELIATGGNDSATINVSPLQASINCSNFTSHSIYGASEVVSDIICSINLSIEENITMSTTPTYCNNATTQLNATPDPINALGTYTYEWTVQGSTTVLGTNANLSININSTTIYNCLVTDSGRVPPDNTASATITVTITQPPAQPTLLCWETATLNTTTCLWEISGTQSTQPTNLECWETTTFNATTCSWDITGTQPAQPIGLECWETTTFNGTTCSWDITGTQTVQPTNLECWETAAFNSTTCTWDISGTQPSQPTNLECWEIATLNNTT
ncbi:MAG: hypothetical protein QNK89_01840 [Lacinutrix sp.]|uniref:hypothetical protein n=1 Tax=Lacinutrix sp. TaxID=1937692 RepID=UPI00309A8E42